MNREVLGVGKSQRKNSARAGVSYDDAESSTNAAKYDAFH